MGNPMHYQGVRSTALWGGDSGENQPIHTVLKAGQLESPERFLSLLAIGGFGAALAGLSVEQFKPEFLDRVRSFIPGDEVYNTQLRLTEGGQRAEGNHGRRGLTLLQKPSMDPGQQ
jgi:hypothetical protein